MLLDASHVLTQTKHPGPMVCWAVLWKYARINSVLFPIALKHTFYATLVETIYYYTNLQHDEVGLFFDDGISGS